MKFLVIILTSFLLWTTSCAMASTKKCSSPIVCPDGQPVQVVIEETIDDTISQVTYITDFTVNYYCGTDLIQIQPFDCPDSVQPDNGGTPQ